MKKRFIAFVLAAVLVMSSAPTFATDDIAGIYGSDEKFAAGDEKRVAEQDSDRIIEIIVMLDDDAESGSLSDTSVKSSGRSSADELKSRVKDRIIELGKNDPGSLGQLSARSAGSSIEFGYDYDEIFNGFSLSAPAALLYEIKNIDGVEAAFESQTYTICDTEPDTYETQDGTAANKNSGNTGTNGASGNVYNFTDPTEAGNYDTQNAAGIISAQAIGYDGSGILIAIIDTGLDFDEYGVVHEAFRGELTTESGIAPKHSYETIEQLVTYENLGIGDTTAGAVYYSDKIVFKYDFGDKDPDVSGGHYHGTHVAGTAAANSGEIIGTAPNAQLAVMKASKGSRTSFSDSTVFAALNCCIKLDVDIVNMSLGEPCGFSDVDRAITEHKVIRTLYERGITMCMAAGNDGSLASCSGYNLDKYDYEQVIFPKADMPDQGTIASPASYKESYAVAAMNTTGKKPASFSSWGPTPELFSKPEIAAAGYQICSAVYNGKYGTLNGTSMASPQMAGMAALVRQRVMSEMDLGTTYTIDRMTRTLLMSTAVPMVTPGTPDKYYSPLIQGAGMGNAFNAVRTEAYLEVPDKAIPKLELGDKAFDNDKPLSFRFIVHNASDAALTFDIGVLTLATKTNEKNEIQQDSEDISDLVMFTVSGEADTTASAVTVPAKGKAYVDIELSEVTKGAIQDYADSIGAMNGMFVSGFVSLKPQDNANSDITIGLPFMSFFGDWTKQSPFDTNKFSEQMMAPILPLGYYYDNDLNRCWSWPSGTYRSAWFSDLFGEDAAKDYINAQSEQNGMAPDAQANRFYISPDRHVITQILKAGSDNGITLYIPMVRGSREVSYSIWDTVRNIRVDEAKIDLVKKLVFFDEFSYSNRPYRTGLYHWPDYTAGVDLDAFEYEEGHYVVSITSKLFHAFQRGSAESLLQYD